MIDMLAASGELPTTEVGMGVIIAVLILKEVIPALRRNGPDGSQRHNAVIKAILDSNKEIVKELYKLRCVFEKRPCVARDLKRNENSLEGR